MRCFEESPSLSLLDRETFKFQHKLMGHPALSLENLAKVLPALSDGRVKHSKGFLKNGDDFESVMCKDPVRTLTIEETIEQIRVSDSYIMVDGPEEDASFKSLYRELISDVEEVMRRCGVGERVTNPRLFMFIASPNSITPFHIDRYSNFLMQFRGSKEVSVFPQWNDTLVSPENREAYVALQNTKLPWKPEFDALAVKHDFRPGDAVHIPFTAGHHVRNGSEDVSISLSIFFSTRESLAWQNALRFNHASRGVMRRVGMKPAPVGTQPWRDNGKSYMWQAMRKVRNVLRPS